MGRQIGGRKVRDPEDAGACLAAVEEAGVSLYAWCCANDVAASSLYDWRRRLAPTTPLAPNFVEVRLAPLDTEETSVDSHLPWETTGPRYEIRVGGCRVIVGDAFREDTLARILRAARAC